MFAVLSAVAVPVLAADLSSAEHALMEGRAADATASLRAAISASPNDGRAHLLLCRVYIAEQLSDQAADECDAALRTLGNNSVAQDWAGRAFGMKADHSGPLSGYKLAKRVKAAFEAAVNLDPNNGDAIDDLGEYYVQAPSIVGGGIDKATAMADRIQAQQPKHAPRLRALIAEHQKDYGTAEREFQSYVEVNGRRADTWIDLGNYYGRRRDSAKALDAFQHGLAADRNKSASLVSLVAGLIKFSLDQTLAERALRDYLSGNNWDDSAPVFKAHTLLAKVLANRGDKAAARVELNKALALAPDYGPAKKALATL